MEVKIDSKELEKLRDSHTQLSYLLGGGVALWPGYSAALKDYHAEKSKEKFFLNFIEDLNDILCEAQVDYPAGRETGYHRIEYDEELVLKFLRELVINIQNI